MAGEEGDYEELPLGKGGARAYVPRMKSRTLSFVHGKVPCTVSIAVDFAVRDSTDRLAALVDAKLNSGNRPR